MPVAFAVPRFYPILDALLLARRSCDAVKCTQGLIEGGARILQYRHKSNWSQEHFDTAAKIAKLCQEAGVLFVINDRADFAKMLGAALHIGQDDLSPFAARRVVSDEVIGFSTHNRAQLIRGEDEQTEYLSLGPIFATNTKERPDPIVGVEGLRTLRPLTRKPLVAIGGITQLNACELLEAGADAVAVISALIEVNSADRAWMRRAAQNWIKLLAQARVGIAELAN